MSPINIQYIKTPLGEMILGSFEERLCLCDWRYRKRRESVDRRIREGLNAEFLEKETSITEKTHQQIREYLDGDRKIFEIPLLMVGTDFQKNVWEELLKIPFGGRETYAGLSRKLTNEKAIRAVAAANGANAIALLIPCHRIVGSGGKLLGYAGGLQAKKKLLQLETDENSPRQMELFD